MSELTRKPKNWPGNVQYINSYRYHKSVPETVRSFIQGGRRTGSAQPSPSVVVRTITSPSHPACGQYGLFATKKIPPGTRIIDYIGEIHCDDRPSSDYDLSLYRYPDGLSVGIDAERMGNVARFINDYRGVQAKPNAVFMDSREEGEELRMFIRSSGIINKGDEILVSYGKSWWGARVGQSANEEISFQASDTQV